VKVSTLPVPDSVPVKPVEGVTVHVLLSIVPSASVDVQAMGTGAFVKAVAGMVAPVTGGMLGAAIVIALSVVLTTPPLSVTAKRMV